MILSTGYIMVDKLWIVWYNMIVRGGYSPPFSYNTSPRRLWARTPDSPFGKQGSIPCGVTNFDILHK
jgi:hypothetical protein